MPVGPAPLGRARRPFRGFFALRVIGVEIAHELWRIFEHLFAEEIAGLDGLLLTRHCTFIDVPVRW